MKRLFYFLIIMSVLFAACKKDSTSNTSKSDQLTKVASNGLSITTQLESFMLQSLSVAADSGLTVTAPPSVPTDTSGKSATLKIRSLKNSQDYNWEGPDLNGWYTVEYNSLGYTITEKLKFTDTTVTYIFDTEYTGSEGSFSYIITTYYEKYIQNKIVLYRGYSDMKENSDGYSNISNVEWEFKFDGWNPSTGAGVYDWYWSATSLGGDPVAWHRYLNIIATEILYSNPPMLHEKITWYDNSGAYAGEWEFDTSWTPVVMPEIPSLK